MKTLNIVLSFLFVFASISFTQAQKPGPAGLKKENIAVAGECSMCRKKIETAALKAGAVSANWNEDSKILAVAYNSFKTNATKIQQSVAAAGYDTRAFAASDEAYNKLPGCCHYERMKTANQVSVNCCSNMPSCDKNAVCCKDEKCDKDNSNCKDMADCREKGCCES